MQRAHTGHQEQLLRTKVWFKGVDLAAENGIGSSNPIQRFRPVKDRWRRLNVQVSVGQMFVQIVVAPRLVDIT